MRDLLLAGDHPRARLALDHFAHSAAMAFGALAAAIGGVDGIVFTAGIGENAAPVRADVCRRCAWLGVELDPARNERHGPLITSDASRVPAYVVPTDEELTIARHTLEILHQRVREDDP